MSEEIAWLAAELSGRRAGAAGGAGRRRWCGRCSTGWRRTRPTTRPSSGSAAAALAAQTAFVDECQLITIYDDPVEVIEMPEIDRGVAVAYCDSPGPLETAPVPTFVAVSPTPAGWPPSASPRSSASTTGTWCTT